MHMGLSYYHADSKVDWTNGQADLSLRVAHLIFCWYFLAYYMSYISLKLPSSSFLDLHLSISDGFVKTKIYDKRDHFDFDIANFPFLDGDVPRSTSYGVIFLNLFGLLECPAMLMTLILVIRF